MSKRRICLCSCVCLLAFLQAAQGSLQTDWEASIGATNPLHWYKFDEVSGTKCLDSGSGKLDGTYDGVQLAQEGFFGPAVGFNRTASNRVNFTGAVNLAGAWTVEYIVKTTKAAAANDSQALHDSDTTSVRVAGWTSIGEAGFTLYGVADYQFTPTAGRTLQDLIVPRDTWMHLAWRRNPASGMQLFFNGELVGTSSSGVDLPRLRIGAHGAGPADMFQGVLDEAIVYNRALSDQDILAHASLVGLAPLKARSPNPADGALAVTMPLVQWKAGLNALFHSVYLGTSPDLTEADLVSARQMFTMYYHVPGFQPGTAYYWRVDEIEKDAVTVHTGDVWSFVTQALTAYHPSPADGAVDASVAPVLTWLPGQAAVKHHLYFGTSADAVSQGTADADKGELAETTFTPGALESVTPYYWRVDELVAGGALKTGPVWSFTTCLPVDDFESYTDDEGSRIYETWIDGWTNGTGSVVGYAQAPFAERTIVHGGTQSMPLDYTNVKSPFYSEAEQTFASAQDWTVGDISTLVLYVRGRSANNPVQLYVAVKDSANRTGIVAHPDPAVVTLAKWTPWEIPLSDFAAAGVNLARVKTLYIGLGDRKNPAAGGVGLIYVDDILITRPEVPPQAAK